MRLRSVFVLAALVSASGCHHYLPSSLDELQAGQAVRLRLTAEEAARYGDLRLQDPRLLAGRVVDQSPSGLMLDATVGVNDAATGQRALTQRLTVPLSEVLDVELRALDTTRTGFLVGGSAVLVGVIIARATGAFGSTRPPGGDIDEVHQVPLFRIWLRF